MYLEIYKKENMRWRIENYAHFMAVWYGGKLIIINSGCYKKKTVLKNDRIFSLHRLSFLFIMKGQEFNHSPPFKSEVVII